MRLLPFIALLLPAAFFCACTTTPTEGFARWDTNRDGKLTNDEVSDSVVEQVFTARDRDGDGIITKAEWNPAMDDADAKMFALRDTNKDGAVSKTEAISYARKHSPYRGIFKKADANRDGLITKDEAATFEASVDPAGTSL
jgi:Ca2+-binding EF-hand superfamily protein